MFSDEQIAALRMLSPQLADALSMMTNSQRKEVKDAVAGIGLSEEAYQAPKKNKGGRPKKKVQ